MNAALPASWHAKELTGARCSDVGKTRDGKAAISLARSISFAKQIFRVKLKLKEMKDDVWLGSPPPLQITTMIRQLLENQSVLNVLINHREKEHAKRRERGREREKNSLPIYSDWLKNNIRTYCYR